VGVSVRRARAVPVRCLRTAKPYLNLVFEIDIQSQKPGKKKKVGMAFKPCLGMVI